METHTLVAIKPPTLLSFRVPFFNFLIFRAKLETSDSLKTPYKFQTCQRRGLSWHRNGQLILQQSLTVNHQGLPHVITYNPFTKSLPKESNSFVKITNSNFCLNQLWFFWTRWHLQLSPLSMGFVFSSVCLWKHLTPELSNRGECSGFLVAFEKFPIVKKHP